MYINTNLKVKFQNHVDMASAGLKLSNISKYFACIKTMFCSCINAVNSDLQAWRTYQLYPALLYCIGWE